MSKHFVLQSVLNVMKSFFTSSTSQFWTSGSFSSLMSSSVLHDIVNPRCFLSFSHYSRQLFLFVLIVYYWFIMKITQIYAIIADDVFLLLMFIKDCSFIQQVLQSLNIIISRYLIYSLVVQRHRLLRSWSSVDILLQLLYISLNVFCVIFRVTFFDEAKDRTETLSIINMTSLFFDLHLSFLADLLDLSLFNYRRIHRFAGIMSFALVALHIFVAVHHDSTYFLRVSGNLYLLIVSHMITFADTSLTNWQSIASLSFLMILSLRFIRKLSYEFFLRIHQALAFLSEYVLWRHLSSKSFVNQVCLYVSTEIFDFTFMIQLFVTLYRNSVFRERLSRAVIINVDDEFKISLIVHDKLKVDAEQYINLWISSISFWFFLQSHSFMIASCEKDEQTTLNLLIDSQKEFIFKLQRLVRYESESDRSDFRRALFTDSHEISASLKKFERVLMIASKFEIVAQLSYLRQLIQDYNDFIICTRRICLIWQLENIDKCADRHWRINR